MTSVIVAGAIANKCHNGGATWTRLSWALGLKQLGFDVYFLEQIRRENCLDDAGAPTAFEESENLAYFRQVTEQYGLAGAVALICDGGAQIHGASWSELVDIAAQAGMLVNISGHLTLDPLFELPRWKVFIDLDPGFTQYWHAAGNAASHLQGHDLYFTVGENIGTPRCSIPTSDIDWRPIRQPSILDLWPDSAGKRLDGSTCTPRFSTVASWRGPYGRVEFDGQSFGLKVHEFRKFIDLPGRSDQSFEIALDIHPADAKDLQLLRDRGWHVVSPAGVASDPDAFRCYVQTSGAEFSAAQGIYVETNSGWFSDRTVRYLSSGKPALVQDTGFGNRYPTGEGLLTFRTLDEAVTGVEQIVGDYDRHCAAARTIAEEYFDSNRVLGELVDAVGVVP